MILISIQISDCYIDDMPRKEIIFVLETTFRLNLVETKHMYELNQINFLKNNQIFSVIFKKMLFSV